MKTFYHTLSQALVFHNQHHNLKKALTHQSFYENSKDDECSKFIFIGKYVFKGKVAEILSNYVPLNGKQLQFYLGNLFNDNQLDKIYHRYQLSRGVRYGKNFSIEKNQNIFVYALMGFVYTYADEKYLNRFIYRNFLEGTDHLKPKSFKNKDLWSQCIYMTKIYYNESISISQETDENNFYVCKIYSDSRVYGEVESKSQQYAKKKCIKLVLRDIQVKIMDDWLSNPINVATQIELQKKKAEAIAKERAKKLKAYQEKQRKRAEEIAIKKSIRKKERLLRDEERRIAKAKAKKRREELEALRRKRNKEIGEISVAKRRHLQDKGQLKKGAPPK